MITSDSVPPCIQLRVGMWTKPSSMTAIKACQGLIKVSSKVHDAHPQKQGLD